MRSRQLIPAVTLVLAVFFLSACNENLVYEENIKIEDASWERKQAAQFSFMINENQRAYDIYLNFRHSPKYPFSNLYLFIRTLKPGNQIAQDTVQMLLADQKGKWLGKGIGDLYDYQFKFKERVILPDTGKYTIEIEQAMRQASLPYVTDIGVRVEKVENEQ